MKTSRETINFSTLDDWNDTTITHAQRTQQGLHDLISKGLLWNGESSAVDNLWKTSPLQRNRDNAATIPFNIPEIDGALPSHGLSCGALHEFYYKDPSSNVHIAVALPTLLARNTIDAYYASPSSAWERTNSGTLPFFIAWIGRRCWPTPFALPQHHLSSFLFIDPPNDALTLWAIETALRSQLIKLVVADCPRVSLMMTRRLSLHAHANGSTALLIRSLKDLSTPSSCATKWSLSPLPSPHIHPLWNLTLERSKGSAIPMSSWTVTLQSDYEDRETLSLRVLPRMVDTDHSERYQVQRFG